MPSSIEALLHHLKATGWTPGPPISGLEVDKIELELGVSLPSDYRCYLLTAGGISQQPPWHGLWNAKQLVSLNQNLSLFGWFRGLVGIGNEGFIVYALDYRNSLPPTVVSVGLSSSDWSEVEREANSFSSWLEDTLPPDK